MLAKETLLALTQPSQGPCVSMFMPAQRGKDGVQQNPIRLKNLIRAAEAQLAEGGWREPEIRALFAPVAAKVAERPFWQNPQRGLAIFLSPTLFEYMWAPAPLAERVAVGAAFALKPLLPLLEAERRFHILTVTRKGARLLAADPFGMEEMPVPEIARPLDDVLGIDVQGRQLMERPTSQRGASGRGAIHYGLGAAERDEKGELLQYFRHIDGALQPLLAGQRAPLVLACVGYEAPIYREANTYPHLAQAVVAGNPDELPAEELHARAWAVAEPHFDRTRLLGVARYRELEGTGRTTFDMREILPAAMQGRVECLFADAAGEVRGTVADGTGEVTVSETENPDHNDRDLLEMAVLQTFVNGGTVYVSPTEAMPVRQPSAAILRY